ncbi:MAG: hypothetical protein ACW98Y_14230 [Candidatus Thorarchaeota archaeon]|jgi:predicted PP-loop superfamily ATPase
MMLKEEILQTTLEIRRELEYNRGVEPEIIECWEHNDGSVHIVLSDRAEKSLFIGPGGRIATELSKRLGKSVALFSYEEILTRRHRLSLTLKRIVEIQNQVSQNQKHFLEFLTHCLERESLHPEPVEEEKSTPSHSVRIAIAYSGGVDSGASLLIMKEAFTETHAVTVDLGYRMLGEQEKIKITERLAVLGIKQIFIEPLDGITSVIERTEEGRIHPCGSCHRVTMESVKKYFKENEYDVLVTGEMLPSGRQSVEFDQGALIVHLPAALALSKYRTIQVNRKMPNTDYSMKFGCRFLSESHLRGWSSISPSLSRVLRELQGGVLTTGDALGQMKSILQPILSNVKSSTSGKE